MPKGDRAKIRELYPTLEGLIKESENHTSWRAFARSIGVIETTMTQHKKWLEKGKPEGNGKQKLFTRTQIDNVASRERLHQLGANEDANKVSVYKITDPEAFEHAPYGSYDGLQLDRVERSKTWGEVTHWGTEGDAI